MEGENGASVIHTDIMALSRDYIAGLIDGEGHFYLRVCEYKNGRYRVPKMHIAIHMRKDSHLLIRHVQELLGGRILCGDNGSPKWHMNTDGTVKRNNDNPWCRLTIGAWEDMIHFIEWAGDDFPLVLKKREYEIWKTAVLFYGEHRTGRSGPKLRQWVVDQFEVYCRMIREERKYNPEVVKDHIDDFEEIKVDCTLDEWAVENQ